MANLKASKKHTRQTKKRHAVNANRQTAIKTSVKKLLKAIETKESPEAVRVLFNETQAQLARAKSKKLIHPRTAARRISRLAKRAAAAK